MNHLSRKTLLPLVALAALLVAGCRSSQPVATASGTSSSAPRYTVLTFDATVNGISVDGQLRMARDSVIWCSLSKFVEVGRAMATPDSVWVNLPLTGGKRKGNYLTVKRLTGVSVDFRQLESIVDGPDTAERIEALARQMGYDATVKIKRREEATHLTFPFKK
ncbi:MAG: DUF4292 domain-containing protein [bacterium]